MQGPEFRVRGVSSNVGPRRGNPFNLNENPGGSQDAHLRGACSTRFGTLTGGPSTKISKDLSPFTAARHSSWPERSNRRESEVL